MVNDSSSTSRQLDQFYTHPKVAKTLYRMTREWLQKEGIKPTMWLEPSAGNGAFWNLLPPAKRLGYDLAPKAPGVMLADFLLLAPLVKIEKEVEDGKQGDKQWVAIGNPPFGKNSAKAVAFFNACALSCQTIAMIFPQTFKKASLQRRLDKHFHLEAESIMGDNCFVFDGKTYSVPCVFQIWVKKNHPRKAPKDVVQHTAFSFVSRDKASFAIQRVGVNAGKVKTDLSVISGSSHYFIKASKNVRIAFERYYSEGGWNSVKHHTAGNPSISKPELVAGYQQTIRP